MNIIKVTLDLWQEFFLETEEERGKEANADTEVTGDTKSQIVAGEAMSETQVYMPESSLDTLESKSLVVEVPGTFSTSKEMPDLSLTFTTFPSFFQ